MFTRTREIGSPVIGKRGCISGSYSRNSSGRVLRVSFRIIGCPIGRALMTRLRGRWRVRRVGTLEGLARHRSENDPFRGFQEAENHIFIKCNPPEPVSLGAFEAYFIIKNFHNDPTLSQIRS